jgi:hypothetical protein
MTIREYISNAPVERQELLTALHEAIITNDLSVKPVIKPMMGKDMILYEDHGYMKYGLADTKKYMSLHCLPIYMNAGLHAKYSVLLPAAQFQKGCINFTNAEEMPLIPVTALITDCALINIAEMLENRKKKSKG